MTTEHAEAPKRYVRVPIAGYITVEIDANIEPKNSIGWDRATEFEQAATEAADELLSNLRFPPGTDEVGDWEISAYPKITAGNLLYVDLNEVEDGGLVEDWS